MSLQGSIIVKITAIIIERTRNSAYQNIRDIIAIKTHYNDLRNVKIIEGFCSDQENKNTKLSFPQ